MIGMISVILAAIALIMVGYLAVGFAGYLAFPRTVSSNVLKTFPDTAIMQVPQLCPGAFSWCGFRLSLVLYSEEAPVRRACAGSGPWLITLPSLIVNRFRLFLVAQEPTFHDNGSLLVPKMYRNVR